LVRLKGLDVLMNAMAALREAKVSPHVYIVGSGPEGGVTRSRAAKLGLTDLVHFVGPLRHHELPDWFRAADATVLPSRSEGIPNVLRESLACGTPFVASRVGGIPEISRAPANRLVPADDVEALATALRQTLSESFPGRCVVERAPTWRDSAGGFRRIFGSLVANAASERQGRSRDMLAARGEAAATKRSCPVDVPKSR
jgi:glycosyltransferase involved in cell wall biosynthesis